MSIDWKPLPSAWHTGIGFSGEGILAGFELVVIGFVLRRPNDDNIRVRQAQKMLKRALLFLRIFELVFLDLAAFGAFIFLLTCFVWI